MKPSRMRTVAAGTMLFILVLSVVSLYASAAPRDREIVIRARQYAFDPSIIYVNRGDRVTLRVITEDVDHGFYIDGYNLELNVVPMEGKGEEARATFVADRPGTFRMRCADTCGPLHPYMIGKFIVGPDLPFIGASAAALLMALLSLLYLRGAAKVPPGVNGRGAA